MLLVFSAAHSSPLPGVLRASFISANVLCHSMNPKGAASFYLDELSVSPTVLYTNDTVTISVNCINNGTLPGSYNVTLNVEGKHSRIKTVTLGPDESATVTFSWRATTGGMQERTFWVYADNLKVSYTVKQRFWERFHVDETELLTAIGLLSVALILWKARPR